MHSHWLMGVFMRVHVCKHGCGVLDLCIFLRNILQKQKGTFSVFM